MSIRNRTLANALLGVGAYLLETFRERMADSTEDWRDRARETYEMASHRASRATAALRGEEDSHFLSNATALLAGVGLGVGVGMLLAPASGEETRRNISDKVHDFGDKVRSRAREVESATGTYGK